MAKQKRCLKCGNILFVKDFYKDKTSKGGYRRTCKICCIKKWSKNGKDHPHKSIVKIIGDRKSKVVKICGFEVGAVVQTRPGEIFAYSSLQGYKICKTLSEAKLFLYEQVVKAGSMINKVLVRRSEKMLKNYGLGG